MSNVPTEAELADFMKDDDVEVGESNLASQKPAQEEKPAKEAAADPEPKEGDENAEAGEGEGEPKEGDENAEGEGEETPKPKKTASDRIRELNKRSNDERRLRIAAEQRAAELESRLQNGGLQPPAAGGNSSDTIGAAPDPTDAAKYPLGHLDDRYIEDKLEWLATKKAAAQADTVLQRQQEDQQRAAQQEQQTQLLQKVDDLSNRGSEVYDDFQELVVDGGLKGEWRLDQPTFEAAHEATNGHQILYELAKNKDEAARVASLSPYQQLKFVQKRDAEIEVAKKPRTRPNAGEPPKTQTKGASSKTVIRPDTDDLDDFEKLFYAKD